MNSRDCKESGKKSTLLNDKILYYSHLAQETDVETAAGLSTQDSSEEYVGH
jgi:hypothetical protein